MIDCAPTESIFTKAAYAASRYVLVPVRPEYFATIGFPLLQQSLDRHRSENRGHEIDVIGVVINNSFYHGGNDGGPEKSRSLKDIRNEARSNGWYVFKNQIPHSRGFPKMMRGDFNYPGNAWFLIGLQTSSSRKSDLENRNSRGRRHDIRCTGIGTPSHHQPVRLRSGQSIATKDRAASAGNSRLHPSGPAA